MKNYCVVGLTGQSGAGKTSVSREFENHGFYIINCDMVSRKVTEKGSECCKRLSEIFPECFDGELCLNRHKMAQTVFSDRKKLDVLNSEIFPFIREYVLNDIKAASESKKKLILLDAPTLFEAEMENICDFVVSVVADENIRTDRIKKRDNISEELIKKRFASQKSDAFFKKKSDFVIENNKDKMSVVSDVIGVINRIKEIADVPI